MNPLLNATISELKIKLCEMVNKTKTISLLVPDGIKHSKNDASSM